jgi:hypothetical protein
MGKNELYPGAAAAFAEAHAAYEARMAKANATQSWYTAAHAGSAEEAAAWNVDRAAWEAGRAEREAGYAAKAAREAAARARRNARRRAARAARKETLKSQIAELKMAAQH